MARVIELFVANHCPSCPDARARVHAFADATPGVVVIEHNVDETLDAAVHYGLFTTPAIVIDGRAVLYGVPTLSQLAARYGATERTGSRLRRRTDPRPVPLQKRLDGLFERALRREPGV